MRTSRKLAVITAAAAAVSMHHQSRAANPADWKTFTSNTAQTWNTAGNWTAGTGIPTSGTTLVVNFDPSKTGTTTSTGRISQSFTSSNDLGTVQLNALNLAGESSSTTTTRTITLSGGTLQFGGTTPTITNSTTTNSAALVNYTIGSTITLDANLGITLNGTGLTTMTGTVSASTGLKTITTTGAGNFTYAGSVIVPTTALADGSGTLAFTHSGTGVVTLGGSNTFTGGLVINSGTVQTSLASNANGTNLGGGAVQLGATSGPAANATLQLGNFTYANAITVRSGNAGTATIQNSGGSTNSQLSSVLTIKKAVTIFNNTTTGAINLTGGIADAGDITFLNSSSGNITLSGANTTYTGNILINSGTVRVNNAAALNSANIVAVDSASSGTFNLNGFNLSIEGLNNGANGGGTITNTGTGANLRTLTLGGSSSYLFGGTITATTPTNLALTVALGSGASQKLTGSSSYAGGTSITGGTLLVSNATGSGTGVGAVSVSSGATLGGIGYIVPTGSNTISIASGGTVSPGESIGTLHIDLGSTSGTYTMASGAGFDFELGASSSSDQIAFAGESAGDVIFNNNIIDFLGTGVNGYYKLFDGSLNTTIAASDSWTGLTLGGTSGREIVGGLSFVNLAPGATGTLFLGDGATLGHAGDIYLQVAVPEPGMIGMLSIGAFGMLIRRRRKAN